MDQQSQPTEVESLLRSQRFYEAMVKCNATQKGVNFSDSYYLFHLKIETINKMDRHMQTHTLTDNLLTEYINCLCELLYEKKDTKIKLRDSLSWMKDFKQRSLIGMINQKVEKLEKAELEKESRQTICEIIFEFKLLMLKTKFKTQYNSLSFEEYFMELSTIIRAAKSIKAEGNLSRIFHDYVP